MFEPYQKKKDTLIFLFLQTDSETQITNRADQEHRFNIDIVAYEV